MHGRLKRESEAIRFHRLTDGEIVVADASAVLEMFLDGSVGMIIYDRRLRLAAASKLPLKPGGGETRDIGERTRAAALALLARLVRRGCDADALEVFALGAPGEEFPPAEPAWRRLGRPSLAMGSTGAGRARRVEFDVGLGRIVIEQERGAAS